MHKILAFMCVGALVGGCGTDFSGGPRGPGGKGDMSVSGPDDGGIIPFDRDAACAQVSADGTLVKKPVDIIFIIDNSGSMTEEIIGVQNNINTNFATIINASGLDYRVIMLSHHGLATSQRICVSMPLSGNTTCTPPPTVPVNTAKFFHYDYDIQSTDSLTKALNTYNLADVHGLAPTGWSGWLRKDAVKMFVEITDDQSTMAAATFDTQLLAKTPQMFGDVNQRNYIFHSIIGVANNNPVTKPWLPSDPVQTTKCGTGAVNTGPQYQDLSKMTGGLRFPICQYANFDGVFQEIAKGVVQGAQVACEFAVPTPPNGQMIDLATVVVDYTPSTGGANQSFTQVANAAACAGDSFYIENSKIILCPNTCTTIKGDVMAKVKVLFDCAVPLN
jgi:hypothetical protein